MKNLLSILKNPRSGGQIVFPRRLIEKMFENASPLSEPQACVFMLLECAYGDAHGGLKEGEMCVSVRRLSRRLNWTYSHTRRLLVALERSGLLKLGRAGKFTLLTWTSYGEICRMGSARKGDACTPPDEECERAFDEFWTLYHERSRRPPRDRYMARAVWRGLSGEERRMALERMEDYFRSLSNMDYVRTGLNYLKNKTFVS